MAREKGFGGGSEHLQGQKCAQRRSKLAIAGLSSAALIACQAISAMAAGNPAAIKAISVDNNQQLVIQFANAGFPAVPHLLDVPGPSHRVVFDFANASLDRGSLPTQEIFSSRITKVLPVIKGVRYQNLTSTPKPTARIVIDLPEHLQVKPKVVKLEEDMVVLSLGDGVDLSVKDDGTSENPGPKSQASQDQEPVAAKEAPLPGESSAAMESAESAAASAPSQESGSGSVATGAAMPFQELQVKTAPTPGTAHNETAASSQPAEAENVGSWDWTAGQPAQAAPTARTAQANDGDTKASALPVVASNTVKPSQLAEQAPADNGSIQAELEKESGNAPAANSQNVQLKPAMPEAGEAAPAPQAAAPQPVEQEPAPRASAPVPSPAASAPAPDAGDVAATEVAPEAPAAPVQRKAPVQKRVSAPAAQQNDPIEQEVRTETPDQAPEQEIDGPSSTSSSSSKLSLPEEASKTTAESKAEAKAAYNKAVQAHLSNKLPEAISEYQNALTLNPEFSQAHCNLGLIFNQQHNYAKALSEFRKALAINPKDAITYNGIGAALRAEKDMAGAIKNWQTAVSLDPKLATAHYNLGTAYEMQKDVDRALESYRQAVKNDYRLGEAYYRMGLIMERKHLNDEASEQYERALKVASNAEFSEDARTRLATLSNSKKGKR
jgi:tetratricopeptide (TPR) repeat protein